MDGRIGLGEAFPFDGYLARTQTPELSRAEHAYAISGSHQTRNWFVGAAFREVAEDFNPEVGVLFPPSTSPGKDSRSHSRSRMTS
jgi:hypothetical protein